MSQQREHNDNEKNKEQINKSYNNDKINTVNQAKNKRKKKKSTKAVSFGCF